MPPEIWNAVSDTPMLCSRSPPTKMKNTSTAIDRPTA